MPRLKPPPNQQALVIDDEYVPPVGDAEIDLSVNPLGPEIEIVADDSATYRPAAEPVVVKTEPEVDDNPLQKALDAQRRAEELQRATARERDEAQRQANERQQELQRAHGDRDDAQYNSVLTAIAAEQSIIDKARGDYAAAMNAQDWNASTDAQQRLSMASTRLVQLEDGKQAFDNRREVEKTNPPARTAPQQQGVDHQIAALQVPEKAREWLRSHPEYVSDGTKNKQLGALHNYLVDVDGVEPFSAAYFEAIDTRFGFKQTPTATAAPAAQPQRRSMPVSAPVSRDVPSTSGQRQSEKITLNEAERRAAHFSIPDTPGLPKLTNAQKEYMYAKNKQKYQTMKANGSYTEQKQ